MSVFIFTGPTLHEGDARQHLDAVYLPPVTQGDVYRAALKMPRAIGIIDGYFDHVPSVWHKEILWALERGIQVYGSASMGALRAAELVSFGMIGVGRVFEWYRDGVIDADDEVALMHGLPENNYAAFSEPLVNIRPTLCLAEETGVISAATARGLILIATSLFYPKRTYKTILTLGAERGLAGKELQVLAEWLPANQINQKHNDAVEMLRAMRHNLDSELPLPAPSFTFERTTLWDELTRTAGTLDLRDIRVPDTLPLSALLEELQLDPRGWEQHSAAAMLRLLLVEEAQRHALRLADDTLVEVVNSFRLRQGLLEPEQLNQWIADNQLDRASFVRLMERESMRRWAEALLRTETAASLPDELRMSARFDELYRRASGKHKLLAARGLENPRIESADITEDDLWQWYFAGYRVDQRIRDDIGEYARRVGFEDVYAFRQAVLREYLYTAYLGAEDAGNHQRNDEGEE
jgi:hypothetical protein